MHAYHVYNEHRKWGRLLGLAPGYRFLFDGDYLGVWFDPSFPDV